MDRIVRSLSSWLRALIVAVALCPVAATELQAQTTNAPPAVDLTLPAFQTIAKSYSDTLSEAEVTRRTALTKILERYRAESDDMLVEKKKTRNVTGIAVATAARHIFETALTNLAANGAVTLPANARREIEDTLAKCKKEVESVEQTSSETTSKAFTNHFDKFIAEVSVIRPGTTDLKWLETTFRQLLATVPAASASPPKIPPQTPAPTGTGTNATVTVQENLPEFFASSTEASNATWLTVGRWIGAMRGLDVISIPLTQMRIGTNASQQVNPMSGKASQLQYIASSAVPPAPDLNFRLKRLPGHLSVQLVEWPNERNGRNLVIRTMPSDRFPAMHGFDLQISVSTGDIQKVIASAATASAVAASAPPPVLLSLSTSPPGAAIVVDGKPIASVITPCKLKMSPGAHALTMSLPGFVTYSSPTLQVVSNTTVNWYFKPDPRFARKTVSVPAAGLRWSSAGVTVLKGDMICVYAEGKWSCASTSATCGPAGYPKNEQNATLYADPTQSPRLFQDAEYGALLMRVGDSPTMYVVGSSARVISPAQGAVLLDINEMQDARLRKNNTGEVNATIIVVPKDLVPR